MLRGTDERPSQDTRSRSLEPEHIMIAALWSELFVSGMWLLPKLFLLGAPILLALITMAALADARMPHAENKKPATRIA